ncbi:hypothetical protein DL98DRAFT_597340 [Cadophora sp. DSE1049]|nr:hypothetical protein DL98DRAFT_597340 [Cadophora sp. DSE1049]
MSIKARHFFTFGLLRTLKATKKAPYLVPNLKTISEAETSTKIKHMLGVADRAGAVLAEAKKLDMAFSQTILDNKRRALIMEAGAKESYLQEWTETIDACKSLNFRGLRQRVVEIEKAKMEQMHDREGGELMGKGSAGMGWTRMGWAPYGSTPNGSAEMATAEMDTAPPIAGMSGPPVIGREDAGPRSIPASRKPQSAGIELTNNVLDSFSAVGPGYTVSWLA